MDKKLYWLVESNGDLSVTCTADAIKDLIEGDLENTPSDEREDVEYTITPVWLTDEEYENLPEAD